MTHSLARLSVVAALTPVGTSQVAWQQVPVTGAPAAYCGHAFDRARGRLVTFGGQNIASQLVNATIEWTGSQWLQLFPAGAPSARSRTALAFDAARGLTVMFGGNLAGGAFTNQTWTWNGTGWSQRTPATNPPSRCGAAMAYDRSREVVVLFGGFVPGGLDSADVWEWNGTNWTQRSFGGPAPSARGAHRMTYDEANGYCLLYGGYSTPQQTTLADCWSWNGTNWTARPAGPGSLCDEVLAYDAARRRVVLFGGSNIFGPFFTDLNQTWEWNGVSWLQRSIANPPSARSSCANGYVSSAGAVLLGGGIVASGTQPTDSFVLRPANPAAVQAFGSSCAGSAGPVGLEALSLPYLGSTLEQRISGGPGNATLGLSVLGFSNLSYGGFPLPIPLAVVGAPGCDLLVGLDLIYPVGLTGGAGTHLLAIPNDPALAGQHLFTEGVVFDPQLLMPLPIAMSPGLDLIIGIP